MWDAGDLADFESYCASFGYDSDSIRELERYRVLRRAVERQTQDLRYTLSDHDGRYDALLADEDVR